MTYIHLNEEVNVGYIEFVAQLVDGGLDYIAEFVIQGPNEFIMNKFSLNIIDWYVALESAYVIVIIEEQEQAVETYSRVGILGN